MPRVEQRTAAKDYPADGINKGDTYYTWSHFRGPVMRSKTYPRPSRLDGSKWSAVFAARENIEDLGENVMDKDELVDTLQAAHDAVEEVGDEYGEAFEAMPGNTLAEERQAKCEEITGELDNLISDAEDINLDVPDPDDVNTLTDAEVRAFLVEHDAADDGEFDVTDDHRARVADLAAAAKDKIAEDLSGIRTRALDIDWDPS